MIVQDVSWKKIKSLIQIKNYDLTYELLQPDIIVSTVMKDRHKRGSVGDLSVIDVCWNPVLRT
jgi:hypothetical protein